MITIFQEAHQSVRTLKVHPFAHIHTTFASNCRFFWVFFLHCSIKVLLLVYRLMLFDLSKMLFSGGFQKLVWTDQMLLSELRGFFLPKNWLAKYILHMKGFVPVRYMSGYAIEFGNNSIPEPILIHT